MQTVELDGHGFCLVCRPMQSETSATVWLGGVCILLPEGVQPVCGETLQDVQGRVARASGEKNVCLWHLPDVPVGISDNQPVYRWERQC